MSSHGGWSIAASVRSRPSVDEIQYAKGHKYLTLVYQIEQQGTRLLWIGGDRTVESFEQFFTMIGKPLSDGIEFVCSDMSNQREKWLNFTAEGAHRLLQVAVIHRRIAKLELSLCPE
jgi:transposase